MKTNISTNMTSGNGIESSLQFRALEEIASMMHSLTRMMNNNLPGKLERETAFAIRDLNLLVDSLQNELAVAKFLHTKESAMEMSSLVISETGELMYERIQSCY